MTLEKQNKMCYDSLEIEYRIRYFVLDSFFSKQEVLIMHAIEKILAKNSHKTQVHTGEIVTAHIDFAEINDLYLQTIYSFYRMLF